MLPAFLGSILIKINRERKICKYIYIIILYLLKIL